MNNTAIFLGSFDPPTNGHLHLISEALSVGVSQVIVVPAFHNPWKTHQAKYSDRFMMCYQGFQKVYPDNVLISGIERDLAAEKYRAGEVSPYIPTVETLNALKKNWGDFKVITTNETYREIGGWQNGEEILRDYDFLIFSTSHLGESIQDSISIQDIPVSSTLVRETITSGKSCPEYVPWEVWRYIKKHGLYRK